MQTTLFLFISLFIDHLFQFFLPALLGLYYSHDLTGFLVCYAMEHVCFPFFYKILHSWYANHQSKALLWLFSVMKNFILHPLFIYTAYRSVYHGVLNLDFRDRFYIMPNRHANHSLFWDCLRYGVCIGVIVGF